MQQNQHMDDLEMYEEVSIEANRGAGRANPNLHKGVQENVTSDTQTFAKTAGSRGKKTKNIFLVIVAAVLLSLLALSLVAVIVNSPLARSSSQDDMAGFQMKIEQLERQLEKLQVIQGTNFTVDQLNTLRQSQDSIQNRIGQLTTFETSTTSQLISVQSLVQTLSQIQTNMADDLSTLRTVNLFQNCIEDTRTCSMSSYSSTYYWRSCRTSGLPINSTGYYTIGTRCVYQSNYGNYLESSVIDKSGSYYHCHCDVTYPHSSGHSSLTTSFTATCTLIVTRCPLQRSILN